MKKSFDYELQSSQLHSQQVDETIFVFRIFRHTLFPSRPAKHNQNKNVNFSDEAGMTKDKDARQQLHGEI
jgi:hypothetical protein